MASYQDKLKDPRWQKVRLKIFERDGWKCTKCKRGDKTLHVHHKKYVYGREPWEYPDHYLVTVCHNCHEDEHDISPVRPSNMPTLHDYLPGGKLCHLLTKDELEQAEAIHARFVLATTARQEVIVRARELGIA